MVASLCLLFTFQQFYDFFWGMLFLEDVFGEIIHPKQSMYGIFTIYLPTFTVKKPAKHG